MAPERTTPPARTASLSGTAATEAEIGAAAMPDLAIAPAAPHGGLDERFGRAHKRANAAFTMREIICCREKPLYPICHAAHAAVSGFSDSSRMSARVVIVGSYVQDLAFYVENF